MTTTLSSREFNQDTGRAKKAAEKGPVIITDRGKPSHVLLTYKEFKKLAGAKVSLADAIAMQGGDDIDFDPPKLCGPILKPVDFD